MKGYAETAARALHEATRNLDEAGAEKAVKRLVETLTAKGRLELLPRIIAAYERIARAGDVARITAASQLGTEMREHLARGLGEKTGRPIEVEAATDPGLLAGAVIRQGDLLLDDTVKRKLELLKLSMIA